jgi:hypothetical protein
MNMVKYAQLHGDQENQLWFQIMEVKNSNNIGQKNMQRNNELFTLLKNNYGFFLD